MNWDGHNAACNLCTQLDLGDLNHPLIDSMSRDRPVQLPIVVMNLTLHLAFGGAEPTGVKKKQTHETWPWWHFFAPLKRTNTKPATTFWQRKSVSCHPSNPIIKLLSRRLHGTQLTCAKRCGKGRFHPFRLLDIFATNVSKWIFCSKKS